MFPWMRTGYGQHTSRYDARPFAKTWSNVSFKPSNSTYNYTYNRRPYQSLKVNAFTSPRTISVQDYSYTKEVPRSYTPLVKSQSEFQTSGTSYSYSSGPSTDFTVSKIGRLEDKEELQVLNNRLSEYISRVRQLWEQRGQIDSSAFLKSTRILEDEIQNLKGMYECELENLRRKLQDIVNERNGLQTKYGDCHHTVKDLEKRLAQEIDKNREMVSNITNLQETISYLEQEIAKLRSIPQPVDDGPTLRKQIADLIRERDDFKARWNQEQKTRKDVEERLAAYSKKAEFDADVLRKQIHDLKQRLEATTSTILSLETRIRELSKTDTNIPQLLSQVRRAAEEELRKHESDIEQKYSKNITSLKQRMDNDASTIGRLEQEKGQILGNVGNLRARIAELESQVGALAQHKQSLQDLIGQERATASAQIKEMDRRFRDLQEDFFAKLNDARFSKDSFIPLKAEIEAMKLLLTEEERRLSAPINYSTILKETYIPATTTVTQTYGSGGCGKEYTAYRPSRLSNYHTKQYFSRR